MENLLNISTTLNNSISSENSKTLDITKIYDAFKLNLDGNRIQKENKLLLENNFIEPSILLAFNYSLEKLSLLFERIKFRQFIVGTRNSQQSEFTNCLIGKNILCELENLIIIIRKKNHFSEKSKLFKCQLIHEFGLDFQEAEFICEGENEIREEIKKLDKELDLTELIGIDNLSKFVYILQTDLIFLDNFEESEFYKTNEIFFFPAISIDNYEKINRIVHEIMKIDWSLLSEYEVTMKNSIINLIKSQSNLFDTSEMEDVYFKNFILNRKVKRNLLIKVINSDNLLSKVYIDYFHDNHSNQNFLIHEYFVINSMENIPSDFVLSMNHNFQSEKSLLDQSDCQSKFKSCDSFSEDNFTQSFNLLKDKKISNEAKSELNKRLIAKIIVNNTKNSNFSLKQVPISVTFISSFYSLIFIISNTCDEKEKLEFEESLYHDKIENNIYKTFDEFREFKLNFLKKKSDKFYNDYKKLENEIITRIGLYHSTEINHFYSASKRYTRIINDLLNIPLNFDNTLQMANEVDLEATLLIYKNLIEKEFEEYNNNLIVFYADYAREFEIFYSMECDKIQSWHNSIVIFTSNKIEALTTKYKNFIIEMKLKLDNYVNEIIERDMKFIIKIKTKLGELGYLNEYLARYLINIQYSLSLLDYNYTNIAEDETIKQFLYTLGFTGGISLASGLATFGLTRVITIIGADAASGSAFGPVGTIAGATVGAISLVGTSVFTMIKNKKKLNTKFEELKLMAENFRDIIYDKILEFRVINKEEMEIRLKNILSYVELSIRKSVNFYR